MRDIHKLLYFFCPKRNGATILVNTNNPFKRYGVVNASSKHYFHFASVQGSLWKIDSPKESSQTFPVINVNSEKCDRFEKNCEAYMLKEKQYDKLLKLAIKGGGEKAIERHVKKQKKKLVNDRIKSLLDYNTEFLELSAIGGMGMKYGDVPRTGIVTGIGKIHNRYCMVIANDATVKGGSVYPVTLKKQLRAQEIAEQNRLPCFYIVESGGAFLPLQAEIFPDKNQGGRAFYNEAVMSAQQIPQIAIVCGSCTAGGAYIPTMADEAIIVHRNGTIFLGGPPLVQAALGEVVTAEELGGATLHCGTSGCTDHFAGTEDEAFEIGRDIMAGLNIYDKSELHRVRSVEEPIYDILDMPGLIPYQNQEELDVYQVIARIVDGSCFREFKKMYGTTLVCGFSYINGYIVGVLGNQGEITETAALKGAHFVSLCSERNIPLLFLQNTSSAMEDFDGLTMSERLKAHGKFMSAVCCSKVPKLTLRIGNGFGSSQNIMGGRCMSPNFIFSWPNATLGHLAPCQLLEEIFKDISDINEVVRKQKIEELANEMSALYTSARILDDGIIKPRDTRKVLSECLQIIHSYHFPVTTDYPVFRM